jgi:hypothetical protein
MLAEIEAEEDEEEICDADRQEVMRAVEENRKFTVDSALTLIMKERLHVQHATLVLEAQARLAWLFKPTAKLIKKRIEDLIEREYLVRDAEERTLLHYLV